METLAKLLTNLGYFRAILKSLITWGSASRWKKAIVVGGALELIACAAVTGLVYLQYVNNEAIQTRNAEFRHAENDGKLVNAATAISACIEATNMKSKNANRSCSVAISQYQDAFTGFSNPIVTQNVKEREYYLMREHVNRVLRSNERIKLLRPADTTEKWLQKHLVTSQGLTVILAATVFALSALLFAMRKKRMSPASVSAQRRRIVWYSARIRPARKMKVSQILSKRQLS